MRQMRSIVVELDPADHAVVFQILRDFRFANAQMLGEFCLQAAVESWASAANGFGGAASAAAREISQPDAQRLAGFDVVRSYLVGIREQEDARSSRSRNRIRPGDAAGWRPGGAAWIPIWTCAKPGPDRRRGRARCARKEASERRARFAGYIPVRAAQRLQPVCVQRCPCAEQAAKAEIAEPGAAFVARRMTVRALPAIPRMPAKAIRVLQERLCDGGLGHHGVRGGAFSCRLRRYRPRLRPLGAWRQKDARSLLRSHRQYSPRSLVKFRRAPGAVVAF